MNLEDEFEDEYQNFTSKKRKTLYLDQETDERLIDEIELLGDDLDNPLEIRDSLPDESNSKMGKRWNEDEIDFVQSNYLNKTDEEIGLVLHRSTQSVETKRKRLGFTILNSEYDFYGNKMPSNMNKKWKTSDTIFLINNYQTMNDEEIANQIQRSPRAVSTKRLLLGLKKNNLNIKNLNDISDKPVLVESTKTVILKTHGASSAQRKWSSEEIKYIKNNYLIVDDMTLGQTIGKSSRSIANKRRELNLYRRDPEINKRKNIDKSFFKTWTRESAYVTGYIQGDGSLEPKFRHFAIHSKDKQIIKDIKSAMQSQHKIGKYNTSKGETMYRLAISIREMYEDLVNLGLVPNKFDKLEFPSIPQDRFWDYIRGYFDSDGGVAKNVESVSFYSSSRSFLNRLQIEFYKREIDSTLDPPKSNNVSVLRIISGQMGKEQFYKNLYDGETLSLKRKKKRFEDKFN